MEEYVHVNEEDSGDRRQNERIFSYKPFFSHEEKKLVTFETDREDCKLYLMVRGYIENEGIETYNLDFNKNIEKVVSEVSRINNPIDWCYITRFLREQGIEKDIRFWKNPLSEYVTSFYNTLKKEINLKIPKVFSR